LWWSRLVSKGKITPAEIAEAVELGHEWAEQHGLAAHGAGGASGAEATPPGVSVRKRSDGATLKLENDGD
jgi:hypothetical protein